MSAIPAGYKQTEVGVLPEDWDKRPFGNIYSEPSRNGIYKTAEFRGKGTRIVNMGEMFGYEFISDQDMNRVALSRQDLLSSVLQDGDLLFGRRSVVPAGAGKCSLVIAPQEPVTFESSIIRVRLNQGDADPRFFYYFFASPAGRYVMSSIVAGTNIKGIRASELKQLEVPLPNKAEQRAIAAALWDVDALLAKLDQLIAKKRDLKQAAMQQLLTGQTRLPGFSGDWEFRRIDEIANVKTGPFGSSLHESDYVQNGTPIITVEHLGEFGVTRQNLPLVSDLDCKRLQAYSLEVGDIVFSRVGSVDRNALIRKEEEGWLFSGRLLRVRPDDKRVNSPYLSYQFHTESFRNSVLTVAVGQTMASLNTQILKDLTVPIPAIEEQTAIATVLSDMDAELAALESRRDKTRALKQGMMQELLTGRIRLV